MTSTNLAIAAANSVNQDRLWNRHMEMAKIGGLENGGVDRQAFTESDCRARQRLVSWAKQRNYQISIDDIGNIFIRRLGVNSDLSAVLTGSHMDTQPQGGKFDGIYGVLAGFEALQAMDEANIATNRSVELVAWSNEEGARFEPGTMGSLAYTGVIDKEAILGVLDSEGISLAQALEATLAATPDLQVREFNSPVAAFIEAHIEQGPILENNAVAVGVVTGIQGVRWMNVTVHGVSGHAGTVPLNTRIDAVQGAVAAIQALNELMRDPTDTVRFTVGRVNVTPNSPNTIPAKVEFSIDFRHPDKEVLKSRGDQIERLCQEAAQPCTVEIEESLSVESVEFDVDLMNTLADAAKSLNIESMHLSSGAFHDALNMSRMCPTAMLFVPCKNGVSHSPLESATPKDLADGARVLTCSLVDIANS